MKYYIQRGLNEYGPYTLADLQRYIASGNIQLTDLTRNEAMNEWVPVSQVIGNIPLTNAPQAPAVPSAAPQAAYGVTPATPATPQGQTYGQPSISPTAAYGAPAASPGAPAYGTPAATPGAQPYGTPTATPGAPQYGAPAATPAQQPYGTAAATPGAQAYGAQPYGTPQAAPGQPYGAPAYGTPPVAPGYPGAVPGYGQQPMTLPGGPIPPDLHWALVWVIGAVTCGLFHYVWMFVQASFVKKLRPDNNAMMFFIAGLATQFLGIVVLFVGAAQMAGSGSTEEPVGLVIFFYLLLLGGAALLIVGSFRLREGLVDYYNFVEPIHLQLSGVMTFFFNVLYFQHHFTRIATWKKTGFLTPQQMS